jgi:hypothetical protein
MGPRLFPAAEFRDRQSLGLRQNRRLSLSERVELRGRSGKLYSFFRLNEQTPLRPIGVTYALAEPGPHGWRLLRVGHTSNLAARSWSGELAEAREAAPDAELLVRLNISRAIREAEAEDLAAAI